MILIVTITSFLLHAQPVQAGQALCDQALENYRAKEYTAALTLAAQGINQDSENAACHHIYGLSLAAVERYKEAENELNRAVALRPGQASYHYDLGFILYQQKKYDAALPALKRAVEIDGENLMARFLLGRTYVSSHRSLLIGNFSRLALDQLQSVASKNPRFPTVHYYIAQIHSNNGFVEKAMRELRLEIEYYPTSAQARVSLGELLLKQGQNQAALEQVQLAEKNAPNVSLVHYALAKIYRENSQLEKAIEAAKKSVSLDATAPDAHYLLGQLYRENGQTDLAQQQFELFEKYKSTKP
jgi:tetratricopeptide (TPR) repeat protein